MNQSALIQFIVWQLTGIDFNDLTDSEQKIVKRLQMEGLVEISNGEVKEVKGPK